MPSTTSPGCRVIQVQVEIATLDKLDEVSRRTHVPRAHLIRMGIENLVNDIGAGRYQLGITPAAPMNMGQPTAQPSFTVVPTPQVQSPVTQLPPGVAPVK